MMLGALVILDLLLRKLIIFFSFAAYIPGRSIKFAPKVSAQKHLSITL